MKILIIGGTGNISTPITRALLEQGRSLTLFNYDPNPSAGCGAPKSLPGIGPVVTISARN